MALAAGWKALFLCSGIFVAGLTEAQVEATDLQGGYPELQPYLAGLNAEVDREQLRVLVPFDAKLPPRVAEFTDSGCRQMPVGMPLEVVGVRFGLGPSLGASRLSPAALAAADARPWPLGDLARASTPAPANAYLLAAVSDAFLGRYGQDARTSAVIVLHQDQIVAERYGLGIGRHTPQRTWSVGKSLTSALVGRAVALGLADVAASPVATRPTRTLHPRDTISTDRVLRMQSGLWTDGPGNRTDALYFGGATVNETAAVAPVEAAPGTRFNYSNNDTLLAAQAVDDRWLTKGHAGSSAIASATMHRSASQGFAFAELLRPTGMTRTTIEQDWQGAPILSSQVWMTARDMARLALLHLNDGQVPDGKGGMVRLLPEGWVRDATTPVGPQPDGDMGYGRAIWLMGPKQGLPEGTYAFLGNRGQIAIIVPSERLVVVRRGFDPHGVRFDGPAFARDIIAALKAAPGS